MKRRPVWKINGDEDLNRYHTELDKRLKIFKMSDDLINCTNCNYKQKHELEIIMFHDKIIVVCRDSIKGL